MMDVWELDVKGNILTKWRGNERTIRVLSVAKWYPRLLHPVL
jgi:hypothetical protein